MEDSFPIKNDFPDWLSPMLVKELRQGVRTRMFVSTFILLQVLMLMDVSLSLLVAAHGDDAAAGTAIFWTMVGLPVLMVLPFGGLNAIGGEIKANTLELTFLTRLTAFRIIVGKWFAIFTQALLLICTVLPYLVLRYFVGGINVTRELVTLASMLGGSALLAAFATGLSAYPSRLIRPLSGVLSFFFVIFGFEAVAFLFGGRGVVGTGPGALEITGLVLCGAIVLVLMLEVGAAKIAPPAENHSAVMRLLALGALAVALGAGWLERHELTIPLTAFVIAAAVCTLALLESPRWIPSLFRPFAARGLAGRIVGRVLYPGWYTGVVYTLLVFAAFGALLTYQRAFVTPGHLTRFIAAAGTLLMPVALIRAFVPRTKRATAFFFVVQALSTLVMIFCSVCDNVLKTSFKEVISFLPLATLLMSMNDDNADMASRLTAVGITTLVSIVVLLAVLIRPMRQARLAERACLELTVPPADAPLA